MRSILDGSLAASLDASFLDASLDVCVLALLKWRSLETLAQEARPEQREEMIISVNVIIRVRDVFRNVGAGRVLLEREGRVDSRYAGGMD